MPSIHNVNAQVAALSIIIINELKKKSAEIDEKYKNINTRIQSIQYAIEKILFKLKVLEILKRLPNIDGIKENRLKLNRQLRYYLKLKKNVDSNSISNS